MSITDQLLSAAQAYAQERGISESRLSTLLFQDGKRLGSVRNGADISVRLAEHAIDWLTTKRSAVTSRSDQMTATSDLTIPGRAAVRRTGALQLVDELRAVGRISTVEAETLREGLSEANSLRRTDEWLLPVAFDPESLRTWVRRICSEMSTHPTGLAKAARLHPGSLTDFLGSKQPRGLSTSTVEAIIAVCRLHLTAPARDTAP